MPASCAEPPPALPDFLAAGLDIIAVGINPSLPAARAGYPFANPRNRFWPALNASRLPAAPLVPGVAAMQVLLERDRIGFTDVVKRATAGAAELTAADFRAGAPRLAATLEALQPRIVWFLGRTAATAFARHALGRNAAAVRWGRQRWRAAGAVVVVTPSPSPANARWRLADLVRAFDQVAALRARLGG